MTRHKSQRVVLFGLASCALILSFVTYSRQNRKKRKSEQKSKPGACSCRDGQRITKATKTTTAATNGVRCKPMFRWQDPELTRTILESADQRAKRWVSFSLHGAHHMVGQVGGRSHDPILILDTVVMKPVRRKHTGIREVAFYEAIQASSKRSGFDRYCSLFSEDPGNCDRATVAQETKLLYRLEPYTPRYFGTVEYHEGPEGTTNRAVPPPDAEREPALLGIGPSSYILLNNATKTFSRPCVLDIKMGTQTFEPGAPEEKRLAELGKYSPQQETFGFRLTAMRIYDPSHNDADADGYVYYPKQFGRSLATRGEVKEALLRFLGGAGLPEQVRSHRTSAIQRILSKLKLIKGWFRDNRSFSFYGSSILVAYEGDTEPDDVSGVQPDMAKAKMIDFGRVRRQAGGDPGYSKGVATLVSILEEILRESFLEESRYISPKRNGHAMNR